MAEALNRLSLRAFAAGEHPRLYDLLGAHAVDDGVRFAVWAPRARKVSAVGDFNHWEGSRHPLTLDPNSGVWFGVVSDLRAETCYKFEIETAAGHVLLKSDPFARCWERPPRSASIWRPAAAYTWGDASWIRRRARCDWRRAPLSIYEVHPGSWRREGGHPLGYRALARTLACHVADLGFTHVELLPITEHPFDGSWGYQALGFFAPTSRFGSADDFRWFVDHLHQRGIGVIMDWVPAHFPTDGHGLEQFDGGPLYERSGSRHPEWDTAEFDYARAQVRNFLTASALYWLREFHVDGLRVDAVASMLYLCYGRSPGHWRPNAQGGSENLDAVRWLQSLTEAVNAEGSGALLIAEESTEWPGVTAAVADGGLGFTFKWNMGWMHDVLDYLKLDAIYRSSHHRKLTFPMMYQASEHFVLPLSHDEVVHGKSSLLHKMAGDDWQKFANLRLLLALQFMHPGKKLLFMGAELAQRAEWDHDAELDWATLRHPPHSGICRLVRDLNRLYVAHPALHDDAIPNFEWLDCHDANWSVLSFMRKSGDRVLVTVANCTPVVRYGYRVAVPAAGRYHELINTDSCHYGGSDVGNNGQAVAHAVPRMGRPATLELTLPPLAVLALERVPASTNRRRGWPGHQIWWRETD